MVSAMRLTSLLFLGLMVGCSSETGGPSVAGDAGNDQGAATDDDTGTPTDDTGTPTDDTGTPTDDAPAAGATFNDVYTKILKGSCAGGYCHGGSAGGWSVKSDAAGTYAELVGPTSSACSGLKKVEPGQPEKSSLYLKVRGMFSGVCTGSKMPTGGSLSSTQLEIVRSWIAAGAKP
jgi:hypothetical protein